jgi:hypothetical protein
LAADCGEIDAIPLAEGPWILRRAVLDSAAATALSTAPGTEQNTPRNGILINKTFSL